VTWEVWTRRKYEVNTDPQRRCYWGVHAKSEIHWEPWSRMVGWDTKEYAEESARAFRVGNNQCEYEVREAK